MKEIKELPASLSCPIVLNTDKDLAGPLDVTLWRSDEAIN